MTLKHCEVIYFLSFLFCAVLLLLPHTAISQCRVGETYDYETLSPVFDATGWYLNLDSPLRCSGTLNSLTVQFYDPTADGRYCLFWALWKPMADGSYHRVSVEIKNNA